MPESAMTVVAAPRRTWLRWLVRIALGGLALVVLLLIAAVVRESFASRADARRFPQQGRSVDVGGFRLNIDCTGTAIPGAPAVILESGLGVPAIGWKLVQPGIAKFARVCSYDRAGYGWSDPPIVTHRTSLQVAKELHVLLQNASVPPPYVLVGHSLGGYNIRVFNGQYPNEVAGAVFVDSSHPDQLRYMTPQMKKLMDDQLKSMRLLQELMPIGLPTGAIRAFQRSQRGDSKLPPDFLDEIDYLQRRKAFVDAMVAELDVFDESAQETRDSGNFGDKPLIVLTAGKQIDAPGIPKKTLDDFQQTWIHTLQPQIAQLSSKGKQQIVSNSDHMIPIEQPQTIVDAVRDVVQAAQVQQNQVQQNPIQQNQASQK
ncbi:MAG TPA: alpha/beta hydrolase [Verrucomicrobiae bacterium]|jgi:pimeloyl-ACP methyl ester carboxylesterase|nr:alpha/beta hydrolase [Verrucomicrobiae bacterium]